MLETVNWVDFIRVLSEMNHEDLRFRVRLDCFGFSELFRFSIGIGFFVESGHGFCGVPEHGVFVEAVIARLNRPSRPLGIVEEINMGRCRVADHRTLPRPWSEFGICLGVFVIMDRPRIPRLVDERHMVCDHAKTCKG